jgi:hypothetical protein
MSKERSLSGENRYFLRRRCDSLVQTDVSWEEEGAFFHPG